MVLGCWVGFKQRCTIRYDTIRTIRIVPIFWRIVSYRIVRIVSYRVCIKSYRIVSCLHRVVSYRIAFFSSIFNNFISYRVVSYRIVSSMGCIVSYRIVGRAYRIVSYRSLRYDTIRYAPLIIIFFLCYWVFFILKSNMVEKLNSGRHILYSQFAPAWHSFGRI